MTKEEARRAIEAVARFKRGTCAYKISIAAIENGTNYIRPCWVSGTGRHHKNMDYTAQTMMLLHKAGIEFQSGNDAPKGGLTGNYIILKNVEK